MDGARAEGAPSVYRLGGPRSPSESELPLVPGPYHHNQHGPFFFFSHHPFRAAAALEAARLTHHHGLFECTWRTQGQCHTPLEPHAAVAEWTGRDRLSVHLSTQACADMATDIAERYGLAPDAVTVLAPHVGGAFGSKSDLTPEAIAAIDLAREAGAPVRVVLERTEEFTVGGYRPGIEVRSAVLGDDTGRIRAISMHAFADGGVAIGSTVAGLCRFPLSTVDKVLLDYDVVSHGAPARPFRGPGGPAACWALERSLAVLCERLGVDWSALRRNNTPIPHTRGCSTGSTASTRGDTATRLACRPGRSVAALGCRMGRGDISCSRNVALKSAAGPAVHHRDRVAGSRHRHAIGAGGRRCRRLWRTSGGGSRAPRSLHARAGPGVERQPNDDLREAGRARGFDACCAIDSSPGRNNRSVSSMSVPNPAPSCMRADACPGTRCLQKRRRRASGRTAGPTVVRSCCRLPSINSTWGAASRPASTS